MCDICGLNLPRCDGALQPEADIYLQDRAEHLFVWIYGFLLPQVTQNPCVQCL